MKKTDLKNYAKLVVKMGVNVQKGQDVVIRASVKDYEFVELVAAECYKAKARRVVVEWQHQPLEKLAYKNETVKTLSEVPTWKIEKMKYKVETLPALIFIDSEDPDGMNGVDQDKLMAVRRNVGPIMKPFRNEMENKYQWTIVALPSEAWAKKVFPELNKKKAVEALWDAIFKCARVYGNPIENWKLHNENLKNKCDILNSLDIDSLEYKSSNGTDFKVKLLPQLVFEGGAAHTLNGVIYNPNMPSEEAFTSPDKSSAEGVVMSTKPLSVMGNIVSDFGFKFEGGKVTEVLAKNPEHKAILEKLVSVDEGASLLGEVALVPFDSPINQTGLLFSNTLFDENACCHLALGMGFEDCIKNFDKMTAEERKAVGLNDSIIHVDFMIGSSDLSIVANLRDGKTVQIFKNGTWAI